MSRQEIRIAIVGGGLSDLSAAALLDREGHALTVYEQAPTFTYLGAGIHLGPNLVRVLEEPGIADRLKATGVEEADIVIGCDGVRSRVREVLVGLERPRYSG
jgi:6-hydroxynicotinate 3-monooxygenase